jgi:hypothetical protein
MTESGYIRDCVSGVVAAVLKISLFWQVSTYISWIHVSLLAGGFELVSTAWNALLTTTHHMSYNLLTELFTNREFLLAS